MNPIIFSGRVIEGEGMAGKVLGCPTANIAIEQGAIIPAIGIYVGETEFDGEYYPSLICVSDGRTGFNLKLEVHLLDKNIDLKDKFLKVELFERLRDTIPFPGDAEMAVIIGQDMIQAREWFSRYVDK